MSNHTFPGHSKGNKSLTVSDYKELLGLAAEARKLIGAKYDRLTVGRYRAFTEARKGGLRTKLWGSGFVKPQQVKDIQDMLTKQFPQLDINVRFDGEHRWFLNSLSIFMRVKPNSTVAKKATVAEKPKARITGTPLVMQSAVVDIATIPAGTISIETQYHICISNTTNKLEFELVDSWLVLNGDLINYKESDKYENFLEMHTGRDIKTIYADAESANEEAVRQSIVCHGKKLFVG